MQEDKMAETIRISADILGGPNDSQPRGKTMRHACRFVTERIKIEKNPALLRSTKSTKEFKRMV